MGKHIPVSEHVRFKYLIDIDSNSIENNRGHSILYSNSLYLKKQDHKLHWYSKALIDGEHYVEIASDLSDLIVKYEFFERNQLLAESIANSGRRLTKKILNNEMVAKYLITLLLEYGRLYQPAA